MAAATVTSMISAATATLEDAKAWVKAMGEKGKWTSAMSKYRVTAIDALASVMGPDDDRTARSVLANVDTLAADWARKNNMDAKTLSNYRGSVRGSLNIYLTWLEDPAKAQAKFDEMGAKPRKPKSKPADTASQELPLAPVPSTAVAPATPVAKVAVDPELDSYPLGDGRVVLVKFPENFTVRDLAKFSCFAATFCVDFDPTRPNQGTIVAMARKDERDEPKS